MMYNSAMGSTQLEIEEGAILPARATLPSSSLIGKEITFSHQLEMK